MRPLFLLQDVRETVEGGSNKFIWNVWSSVSLYQNVRRPFSEKSIIFYSLLSRPFFFEQIFR
jgi:hypothetical protein